MSHLMKTSGPDASARRSHAICDYLVSLASLLLIAFAVWLRGLLASAYCDASPNSAVYPSPVAINSLGTSSSVGRIRA